MVLTILRLTLIWAARSVPPAFVPPIRPAGAIGRQTVMVANLAPRKMRFGVSKEGMVMAVTRWKDIFLLSLDAARSPATIGSLATLRSMLPAFLTA